MTWAKKYDNEDLLKVNRKELSIEDLMKKYNVSRNAIYMAFKHKGIQVKQKGVKIISPYGSKICKTRQECCDELGISSVSLWKALHGKRVAVLEELGIKLIDIENTENKNEDITN